MSKRRSALAAALLSLSLLAGCGSSLAGKTVADYKNITAASLGSDQIKLSEVNYYLRDTQELYERIYSAMTDEDIWASAYSETMTFGEYVRSVMVNKVYQIHLLNSKAQELGISLSEEDKAKAATAVDEWLAGADDAMKAAVGEDKAELVRIYENNALANLVYEAMIADVDRNVTDEEARQWSVEVVSLSDSAENYNAEEVKDEILERVQNGEDISEVASSLDLNLASAPYTLGKEGYASSFGPTAVGLATGESAAVHSDTTGYWYVIYCTSDFDEHETEHEKERIVQERETELFEQKYGEWKEAAPEFKPNQDAIDLLDFKTALYIAPETMAAPETVSGSAAENMAETGEMSETESMMETEEMSETESMMETEEMSETESMMETEEMSETETTAK